MLLVPKSKCSLFRQDKKKKSDAESEDEKEDSKAKKAKKSTEQDAAEDINEEDELLYMQAMDMEEGNCNDMDDAVSHDERNSTCGDAKPMVTSSVPAPACTKRSSAATATDSDLHQPKQKIQKTSLQVALKSSPQKKGQKATPPAPGPASQAKAAAPGATSSQHPAAAPPLPSAGASSAPATRHVTPASPPPTKVDATTGIELVSRKHWSQCQPFKADDFASTAAGSPWAMPTKYSKDTQKAKWTAEVTKIKPFICTLERMLSSDGGKVKDTELKNAVKAFQKINSRVDKRLEFEPAAATAQEPTFSARIMALKDMFEAVKSLKETAISSGKSGSIAEDILKTAIERINASVEKLVADTWIGYPLHWVQAPHWDWVWSLDSGVCLCFSSSLSVSLSLCISVS